MGCKYCQVKDHYNLIEVKCIVGTQEEYMPVNYCPYCGRQLTHVPIDNDIMAKKTEQLETIKSDPLMSSVRTLVEHCRLSECCECEFRATKYGDKCGLYNPPYDWSIRLDNLFAHIADKEMKK